MATAEELLASAEACDDILTVDLDTQTIIIPKNVTIIGVESDDSVRYLHFRVPRYFCKTDLSEFSVRINYTNAKSQGDLCDIKDVVVEDDWIKFDWLVGRYAVTYKGNVDFNVCMRDVDGGGNVLREFNTTPATLPVLRGLETGEAIIEEHVDILEQWRADLFGTGDTVEQEIRDAGDVVKQEVRDAGTEAMSDIEGAVVTYVNENSDALKGPKGDAFTYEDFTEEQLQELTGPTGASIQSIVRTSGNGSPGTIDTYTITLTNGVTSTFSVYNGKDGPAGSGSGDMLASVYDPQGKRRDIFKYVDDAVSNLEIPDASIDPSNLSSAVPISKGGTGATTAAAALTNLGAVSVNELANYSTTEQMNAAVRVVDDKFVNYSTTEQMNAAIAAAIEAAWASVAKAEEASF